MSTAHVRCPDTSPLPKPSRYAARAFLFLHPVNSKPIQAVCPLLQRAGHVINTTATWWRIPKEVS